jgi:hypothetical protein
VAFCLRQNGLSPSKSKFFVPEHIAIISTTDHHPRSGTDRAWFFS